MLGRGFSGFMTPAYFKMEMVHFLSYIFYN